MTSGSRSRRKRAFPWSRYRGTEAALPSGMRNLNVLTPPMPDTRETTTHVVCLINGYVPYRDEPVRAAVRLVRMWDYPAEHAARMQRDAQRAIRLHMGV